MKPTRRTFLISSGLAFIVGGAVITFGNGLRAWLNAQIEEDFGSEIAQDTETSIFLDDYLIHLERERSKETSLAKAYFRLKPIFLPPLLSAELEIRGHMLNAFLRSTNAVRVLETGEDLHYAGIFDPANNPCSNQLAAQALL